MAQWYYARHGQQGGPVGESDLKALVANGGLGSEDLVWSEGMTEWVPFGRAPQLQAAGPADAAASPAPAAYPSPYSAQPPAPAYGYPQQPSLAYQSQFTHALQPGRYSGLAMTSMILGAASFVVGGPVVGIAALVCGWIALSGMKRNGEQHNRGYALAGLIIGICWLVLTVALIILIVALIAFAPSAAPPATGYSGSSGGGY